MSTDRIGKAGGVLGRILPEKQVYMKSDGGTRYIRLSSGVQGLAVTAVGSLVLWSIFAAALVSIDVVGSGSLRDQSVREREMYETRIAAMAAERDAKAAEARRAQQRFSAAMTAVSDMQENLLALEEQRDELGSGLDTVHATLRRAMSERESARTEAELAAARLEADAALTDDDGLRAREAEGAVDVLAEALTRTAAERDAIAAVAAESRAHVDDLILEGNLVAEHNDRIFSQLEEAVEISVEPLDQMFRAVGLDPEKLIETVRNGRGTPGALGSIRISTKNGPSGPEADRANAILARLAEMDVYREAAERTPLAKPIRSAYRNTSGFGPRWGRMHEGSDFAGAHGTSILSTADGTVVFAGRQSGYGNLIKIQHQFGIETRYAHLSRIRVKVGQKVSRGDHIGDMGNTGRSTGTHLHYEVRVNGRAVDPMTYIKAAQDVL